MENVGLRITVDGVARANSQVRSFGAALNRLGAAGGAVRGAVGGVTGIIPAFGRQITAAANSMRNFGRSMTSAGSIITTVGFRISTLIGLPIAAFFGGTVKAAAGFEDALTKMVTLVGLGAGQVEDLGGRLLELAPALGAEPADLASAAYFVLSNRITDTATALDIVERSAKGTAIGLGETENIAKILTAAVISYGVENLTAAEAADQLVAAVQRGAVEADEFAAPLGRMLGLASNLGISFAEATSFITTFTSSGVSASEAVTGLNRVMASFVNPSNEAKEALAQIGLTSQESVNLLAEKGLAGTLIELRGRFNTAGVSFSDFVGRLTGLNAALFVTGGALDQYIDTVAAVEGANDTLENSFQVVTETTTFQFNQLKAQLQVAAITIGSILLPAINEILQRLLPLIAAVAEFAKQNPKIVLLAAAFGILVAVMGPLVVATGLLISSLGILASAIGTVITVFTALVGWPFILITGLTLAAATIGGLFVGSLKKMGKDVDLSLGNIAKNALTWGRNIIVSLANGIAQGAVAVVNALIGIGRIIAGWLKGGSPPKLLPDLPEWGANAMNEFLKGFTEADFGIFDDVAGVVGSLFRSLEGQGIDEKDVIPRILGSRKALAVAVQQIKETGTVTQSVLDRVSGSFGSISGDVQDYILILADLASASREVASAQGEIDEINARFERNVKPLNDELGQIRDRYDEIKEAQERQKLEAVLEDPRAPALARELALLGLRELELKGQVSAEEEQRDAALEVAEARLKAAQAEESRLKALVNAQREFIETQIEGLDLIRQQEELLERLKEEAEDLEDALKGAGEGLPGPVLPFEGTGGVTPEDVIPEDFEVPSLTDIFGIEIEERAAEIKDTLSGFWQEILDAFAPVQARLDELTTVWAGVFLALEQADFSTLLAAAQTAISDIMGGIGETISNADWETRMREAVRFLLTPLRDTDWLGAALEVVTNIITPIAEYDWWGLMADVVVAMMDGFRVIITEVNFMLQDLFQEYVDWVAEVDWTGEGAKAAEFILDGLAEIVDFVLTVLPEWLQDIQDWIDSIDWYQIGFNIVTLILNGLKNLKEFITVFLPEFAAEALEWFQNYDWKELGETVKNGILAGIVGLASSLISKLVSAAQGAKDAWDKFWDTGSPSRLMIESARDIMEGVSQGIDVSLPQLTSAMLGAGAAGHQAFMSGTAGTTTTSNVTFGDVNINNGMDQAVFEARVRRIVAESI